MKNLTTYITEKLKLDNPVEHKYFPKTREELDDIISKLIEERGNNADLNDIDVSKIDDFNCLFSVRNFFWFKYDKRYDFTKFNGNISNWNVSNVTNMERMFYESVFNGDISNWNVSNVIDMSSMFAESKFTGENTDISNWDVSNVTSMCYMFRQSEFNGDISNWDVSNVKDMEGMFTKSKFTSKNGDISNWKLNKKCNTRDMFKYCPLENEHKKWPQNYKGD